MKKESKEKLVEKNIKWEEAYTDKTQFLKDQFDDVVGPGSYFRFEGKAPDGDEYYCIVGPAKVHAPKAKFFAGVRKLPATYSAGGKYFDSLDRAAAYARDTWGVKTPDSLRPYTSKQLFGISKKVTEWKNQREESEEGKDDKDDKDDKKDIEAFTITYLQKEAMPPSERYRLEYDFDTYEAIASKKVDAFNKLANNNPTFWAILDEIRDEKRARYSVYQMKYGLTTEQIKDIYRVHVGYSSEHGMYAIHIGAYMMPPSDQQKLYKLMNLCRLVDGKAVYVGKPKDGVQQEGEPLYTGTKGGDIPKSVLKAIVTTSIVGMKEKAADNIQSLKKKASLYYADQEGAFQIYKRPYSLTKEIVVDNQLDAWKKKQGLDMYDDAELVGDHEQAAHIGANGVPMKSRFNLGDYSYVFSYNRGKTKGGNTNAIYSADRRAPNGMDWEPNMPANSTENVDCQTYSLDRFEEAKRKSLVVSPTGTKGFLNRTGQNRLLLNQISQFPEYNDELLAKLRSLADSGYIATSLGSNKSRVANVIFRDMPSLIYALTGIGTPPEGLDGLQQFENGYINPDHIIETRRNYSPKCGKGVHNAVFASIRNFYAMKFHEETGKAFSIKSNAEMKEVPDRWKPFAHMSTLRNNGSRTITGGFLDVSVARTNESFKVSSYAKNKVGLIHEIAEYMLENGIEEVNNVSTNQVKHFLNSGGSQNHSPDIRRSRKDRLVFDEHNVVPFMDEVIKGRVMETENGAVELSMEQVVQKLAHKKKLMRTIFSNEHSNRSTLKTVASSPIGSNKVYLTQNPRVNPIGKKYEVYDKVSNSQISEVVDTGKDERGIYIELVDSLTFDASPENGCAVSPAKGEDESDSLNLVWQEDFNEQGEKIGEGFKTFGAYDNFHQVHEYAALSAEQMMVSKQESSVKRHDPATFISLMPVDSRTGKTDLMRVPFRYLNRPQKNIQAKQLSELYAARDPEIREKLRESRSIPELTQAFNEEFGVLEMDAISAQELEWQVRTEPENVEDVEDTTAEEDEVVVDIPPTADETAPEDETATEEDPFGDAEEDPFGDAEEDPFGDGELEPDGEFGMETVNENGPNRPNRPNNNGDDDDLDFGINASKSTINSLLKLSKELDEEGKSDESVELLRLAKKFSRNIKKG